MCLRKHTEAISLIIFKCDEVTQQVLKWQKTHDKSLLADILDGCRRLVEAIASAFDYTMRDDLIQESFVKIQYALPFFDPNISNLHTYLTTVIRRCCLTYVYKYSMEDSVDLDLLPHPVSVLEENDAYIVDALIEHNRERFPSIPADALDEATEYIYYAIRDKIKGKSRGAVAHLMGEFDFHRRVATVLYHTSLVFLRRLYIDKFSYIMGENAIEFSLLPELKETVGEEVYNAMLVLFSGMYIKVP